MSAVLKLLLAPIALLVDHWSLFRRLVVREIVGRYQESVLGMVWVVVHPLIMLVAYTFVFGLVLGARWPNSSGIPFAMLMYSGLVVAAFFVECLARSPQLVIENANYVKKVVFPIDLSAWVMVAVALVHMAFNVAVFMLICAVIGVPLHIHAVLLPLLLVPLVLTTVGMVWFVASLAVYLRDLSQVAPAFASLVVLFSPVFYPTTLVPESMRWVVWMNPVTPAIEVVRNLVFRGQLPDMEVYLLALLVSVLVASAGHAFFTRLRRGFSDVI